MKSVMTHNFSRVPSIDTQRSSFDRSCGYKTTFDAGYLIPFFVDDVLPGDTFNCQTTGLARINTPIFPIMDNMYLDTHYFFVPLRLIWDNARKFFGEQTNPTDSIDYALPVFNSFTPAEQSLSDYMELPPNQGAMTPVSLYHRAYNFIYNEWFRDQNLQNSVHVDTDDGPDNIADYVLLKRGKRHDYFTSALPWPQKGDAVTIPLGTQAPITGLGISTAVYANDVTIYQTGDSVGSPSGMFANSGGVVQIAGTGVPGTPAVYADLTNATSATINDIREAFQVQRLLEHDARGGTRYSELVKNHFGVSFYDVSYRPEYLGGGSTPINVTPIAATANTGTTTYPGDLGAMGTTQFGGHGFTKSFVEHGIVIGLLSVRADLTYQQGIPRRYLKSTRYDIYWPTLAHLGEQAITNDEIYHTGTATDDDVFGYQERYAEYRYKPSAITGLMRSTATASLDAWHLSQEFGSLPQLGPTFIEETPPIDRVIRYPTEPQFTFDSFTTLKCARPMPVFGVPGMIDHF